VVGHVPVTGAGAGVVRGVSSSRRSCRGAARHSPAAARDSRGSSGCRKRCVGGRAVIRADVGAVAAVVAAHPVGAGGNGGGEENGGEASLVRAIMVLFCSRLSRSAAASAARFQVRSLEHPSPAASQSPEGFLQLLPTSMGG